jgi:hypothetical protein
MRSARVEGPAVVFAFAVVLALAVARPFVCHSAAQRRNLLLVLSIAYFGQILHARYHGTDTWLWRNGRWQIRP